MVTVNKSRKAKPAGVKRSGVYRDTARSAAVVTRKAGREAKRAVHEVAGSAEAQRALSQARAAVRALGKAASAATALIRTAWRTSGHHIQSVGSSRELRALQLSAGRAARSAAAAARAAGAKVEQRGAMTWKRAVTGGKDAVSSARNSLKRTGRRLRAAATRK